MNQFLVILKEYWKIIVALILLLISFILRCVQKKPIKIVDSVREALAVLVPYFIRVAEDKIGAGNGDKKKNYAIDLAIDHVKKTFNLTEEVAEGYRPFIGMLIQSIFDKLKEVM